MRWAARATLPSLEASPLDFPNCAAALGTPRVRNQNQLQHKFSPHKPQQLCECSAAGPRIVPAAYAIGATLTVAALQYMGIVFSFAFGVLWFGEAMDGPALAGSALSLHFSAQQVQINIQPCRQAVEHTTNG